MGRSLSRALAAAAAAALFLVATQGLATARLRVFDDLNLFIDDAQVCTDRVTFIVAVQDSSPDDVVKSTQFRAVTPGGTTVIPRQDLLIGRDSIGRPNVLLPYSRQYTLPWSTPLAVGTVVDLTFDDTFGDPERVVVRACSSSVTADVDIVPGEPFNRINPARQETIPVAVLNALGFDPVGNPALVEPTDVETGSVRFGRNGTEATPVRTRVEDADSDGDTDLVLRVRPADSGIPCGSEQARADGEQARVTGTLVDGTRFDATDPIITVKCQPK